MNDPRLLFVAVLAGQLLGPVLLAAILWAVVKYKAVSALHRFAHDGDLQAPAKDAIRRVFESPNAHELGSIVVQVFAELPEWLRRTLMSQELARSAKETPPDELALAPDELARLDDEFARSHARMIGCKHERTIPFDAFDGVGCSTSIRKCLDCWAIRGDTFEWVPNAVDPATLTGPSS